MCSSGGGILGRFSFFFPFALEEGGGAGGGGSEGSRDWASSHLIRSPRVPDEDAAALWSSSCCAIVGLEGGCLGWIGGALIVVGGECVREVGLTSVIGTVRTNQ